VETVSRESEQGRGYNQMKKEFDVTKTEVEIVRKLEQMRPQSLRKYDQIPMHSSDLLKQVKRVAPYLAGKKVAFVGDHDGTSILLGLLYNKGIVQPPSRMILLDFDERLIVAARTIAVEYGFAHLLETLLYNVFDPLPPDLIGRADIFYTNPPYGASNEGISAQLFITRGSELVQNKDGTGYLLLPDDPMRPWTQLAMNRIREFISHYGWHVAEELPNLHSYHLDDDPNLKSSFITICQSGNLQSKSLMPWVARTVHPLEIPNFYGRSVQPPYPKYIAEDGQEVYSFVKLYQVSSVEENRNTWIFQANPAKYDIHNSLKKESLELWGCLQHKDKIKRGDRVLVWVSGKSAGVYAVGTIMSEPSFRPDSPEGLMYWSDPLEGLSSRPRVWVKYERVLLERPLLRDYLRCDPELWGMTILAQPRGTNFAVNESQWQALEVWLEE
jgi:N4-bis(aminopropyl)spermidine synthase